LGERLWEEPFFARSVDKKDQWFSYSSLLQSVASQRFKVISEQCRSVDFQAKLLVCFYWCIYSDSNSRLTSQI